jgi:hypothetical protein
MRKNQILIVYEGSFAELLVIAFALGSRDVIPEEVDDKRASVRRKAHRRELN